MSDHADIVADSAERIFRDLGAAKDRQLLWRALEDAGLTRTWIPESLDGAGASIADGFEVLRIAGKHAIAVPLAETLLGGWLLSQAGIEIPNDVLTIAPVDARDEVTIDTDRISARLRAIPFARDAKRIAIFTGSSVGLVDTKRCEIVQRENLAGDPRDAVVMKDVVPVALQPTRITFDELQLMGATARAMQMAGALQTILDMSAAYANERIAFEKPIGKFQAIQHSLARLAGEVAAAVAAAGSAADAINSSDHFNDAVFLEVASAKIRVGEAVTTDAAIAHQVHGAIGFSQEHALHCYTQRLWAWRDDFGVESDWAVRLGKSIAQRGADALWPMLASL